MTTGTGDSERAATMQTRDIQQLERLARRVRAHIVRMVGVGKKGHLGGGCSAADIVTALYFYKMRHDPKTRNGPIATGWY